MSSSETRNPVLLVHGIDDTGAVFHKMISYLQQSLGCAVYSLDLTPNNGDVGLDELADQVATYVDRTFTPKQAIDLVGFSMGGIISRYYVQRLGGIQRVHRFVTISSPHQGTWTAYCRFNKGCNQMRWGSLFLQELNREVANLEQINFTSIWTPLDLMIVPAHSSRVPVGQDVVLNVLLHSWMVSDTACLKAVAAALSEPLRRTFRPHENTPLLQK